MESLSEYAISDEAAKRAVIEMYRMIPVRSVRERLLAYVRALSTAVRY